MRSISSNIFRGLMCLGLAVMLWIWGVATSGMTNAEAPMYVFGVMAAALAVIGLVDMCPTYNPADKGYGAADTPDQQDRFVSFFKERWANGTLLGFFLGEHQTASIEALGRCYQLEKALAAQLKQHAQELEYDSHGGIVEEVAARREESAEKIAGRLRLLGAELPEVDTDIKDNENSWGRIKVDYEDFQTLIATYSEVSVDIDSSETGEFLLELAAVAEADEPRLMELIAKSDPFAVEAPVA